MDNEKLSAALLALSGLVSRLRGPGGCPWDATQTDSTIKMYLLEEAYEVLDAIEKGSPEDVCQELGDLLFQIMFLAVLADERGEFDLADVMERITEKMVTRHPHVFGSTRVNGPEEVAENWARIKNREKGAKKTFSSQLRGIPENLPALLRAHRLSERASKMDLGYPDEKEAWATIEEEFEGIRRAINDLDNKGTGEDMGNILFSLVNLSRIRGFNAENLLRDANKKFIESVSEMEQE